jgi:hypothetical protein
LRAARGRGETPRAGRTGGRRSAAAARPHRNPFMAIVPIDARASTESARKAAWLNLMDDSGDSVEAVRSSYIPRGRAEVWRRDDAGFAEGFDARYRDVDLRLLNAVRREAQAGDVRAASLCLRVTAGLKLRTPDDADAESLPSVVTAAMLAAGLAAMRAFDA